MWATGVVGLMLSLLADFAPTIAGPFAILTVLGSLTSGGDKALASLFGAVSPSQSPAGAGSSARSGQSPPANSSTPTPAPVGG